MDEEEIPCKFSPQGCGTLNNELDSPFIVSCLDVFPLWETAETTMLGFS